MPAPSICAGRRPVTSSGGMARTRPRQVGASGVSGVRVWPGAGGRAAPPFAPANYDSVQCSA